MANWISGVGGMAIATKQSENPTNQRGIPAGDMYTSKRWLDGHFAYSGLGGVNRQWHEMVALSGTLET